MVQILVTTITGVVQFDYKEEIQEGRTINDIFTTFFLKGDDGMPVSLRFGDKVSINKIPKES